MSKLAQQFRARPIGFTVSLAIWWTQLAVIGVLSAATIEPDRFRSVAPVALAVLPLSWLMLVLSGLFIKAPPGYALQGRGRPILQRLQMSPLWERDEAYREHVRKRPIRTKLWSIWTYATMGILILIVVVPSWSFMQGFTATFLTAELRIWTTWLILLTYAIVPLIFMQLEPATE